MVKDTVRLIQWLFLKIYTIVGWIGDGLLWVWDNVLLPFLNGLEKAYRYMKELVTGEKIEVDVNQIIKTKPKPETKDVDDKYFSDLTRFKGAGVAGSDDKEKNKKKSKETGDTIAGGGTKYITINLGKFFDNIQFTTMNMTESSQEIEKILMELMGRVLFNGGKNM